MDLAKWLKIMAWLKEKDYFIVQATDQGRDDYAGYFAGQYPPNAERKGEEDVQEQ